MRNWKALKQSQAWFWLDWWYVWSQNSDSNKWKARFECHVETCIEWMSFYFTDFLSNLVLKMIGYFVTDQPSITWSRTFVLNPNFQFSLFWCWWPVLSALSKKCVKRKYFNSHLYRVWEHIYSNKIFLLRDVVYYDLL